MASDPEPVLGCYSSAEFPGDIIRIDREAIYLRNETIYSSIEYFDTQYKPPIIHAYPRGFLWSDGDRLEFAILDDSGGVTLFPELGDGQRQIRIPVFASFDVSDYGNEALKLVAFRALPCLE